MSRRELNEQPISNLRNLRSKESPANSISRSLDSLINRSNGNVKREKSFDRQNSIIDDLKSRTLKNPQEPKKGYDPRVRKGVFEATQARKANTRPEIGIIDILIYVVFNVQKGKDLSKHELTALKDHPFTENWKMKLDRENVIKLQEMIHEGEKDVLFQIDEGDIPINAITNFISNQIYLYLNFFEDKKTDCEHLRLELSAIKDLKSIKEVFKIWLELRKMFSKLEMERETHIILPMITQFEKFEEEIQLYQDFVHVNSGYTVGDFIQINVTQKLKSPPCQPLEKETSVAIQIKEMGTQTDIEQKYVDTKETAKMKNTSSPINNHKYLDVMDKKCGTEWPIPTLKVYNAV
jgi:hypothetical protein